MNGFPFRCGLLGFLGLLAISFGLGEPTMTSAAGTIISGQPGMLFAVAGLWNDSGVDLVGAVPNSPIYESISITDATYLRVGWIVKVGNEHMLVKQLIDNPSGSDTMVVWRAQDGTGCISHASGEAVETHAFTVDIMANGVSDPDGYGLGAFVVDLTFPSNVEMIKFTADTAWLTSTERVSQCWPVVEKWAGTWEVECFTFNNPGVHPFTADAAVTTTTTTLTDTRQSWTANQWKDYRVMCNGKTLVVTGNTATTLTGTGGWSGGGNPGNGKAYTINQPSAYTADAAVTTTGGSGTADAAGTANAAGMADAAGTADPVVTTTEGSSGMPDAAVTTTNTTLTDTRAAWTVNRWVGAVVTSNGKTMTVTSNTATTLTGTGAWSGGGNPGNGNAYIISAALIDTRAAWTANQWVGAVVTSNGKTMTVTGNTATTLAGASWSDGGNPGNGQAYTIAAVTTTGDSVSGTADAAVTTTDTTLVDTRVAWTVDQWVGAVVTSNGKTMTVTSNDATTLAGAIWSGGGNPGNGNAYTMTRGTLTDTRATWTVNQWVGAVVTSNGKTMTVTGNTATTLTGASWSGGGNPGSGQAYTIAAVTTTNITLTDSRAAWGVNQWVGHVATSNGKTMTVTANTTKTLTGTGGWSGGGNPGNGNAYTISGTLTDTRRSWTVNQWKDYTVTSNGKTMVVTSNTANTLTGADGWSGVGNPGNGEAYWITEPSWYPSGPMGSGRIARVTLLPPTSGTGTVSLAGSQITNVKGDAFGATVNDLLVRTVECPDANGDGKISIGDLYVASVNSGDKGVDTLVTLVSAMNASATTAQISDQSKLQVNDPISSDAELMTVTQLTEGTPDTMTVTRAIHDTVARSHKAGAHIYRATYGGIDGVKGYTRATDVDGSGTINIGDIYIIAQVTSGTRCPAPP